MEMKNSTHAELRKQAWDYFAVHASQRMTVFNFYIILSSLVATSYFAISRNDSNLVSVRPVLAGLLCLFSFTFWKLDQRTKFLIKNAECALKFFEQLDQTVDDVAKVFTREQSETESMKLEGWWRRLVSFHQWQLSYSDCFNFVFLLFFVAGLIGLVLSLLPRLR